jgi:hypothetical protein
MLKGHTMVPALSGAARSRPTASASSRRQARTARRGSGTRRARCRRRSRGTPAASNAPRSRPTASASRRRASRRVRAPPRSGVAHSTHGVAGHSSLNQKFTAVARVRRTHCAKDGGKRAAGRSRRALWAAQGGPLLGAATPEYDAALPSRRSCREAGGRHFGLGSQARTGGQGSWTGHPTGPGVRPVTEWKVFFGDRDSSFFL